MTRTVAGRASVAIVSSFSMGVLLSACSGGGGGSDDESVDLDALNTEITVTREACTPFGAPPRPLQATNALFQPTCITGGERMADWTDAEGTTRTACLYEPAQASTDAPLPLVVYLHPSIFGPDISLAFNNVRGGLETADLSGDPERPGFIMLAPYGRVTERYYPFPDDGLTPGWDNWYRQLLPDRASRSVNGEAWPINVDVAAIDHFLDEVVASGKVDTDRIYLMGWSNGSAMAVLYALNRPEIAAAAVYSSPDPFEAFNDPCVQLPVPDAPKDDTELQVFNAGLPIFHIHNDCDLAGLCPNGLYLKQTVLGTGVADFTNQIINTALNPVDACVDACGTDPLADYASLSEIPGYLGNLPGYTVGLANHLRWPIGYTDSMYAFLRDHPKH